MRTIQDLTHVFDEKYAREAVLRNSAPQDKKSQVPFDIGGNRAAQKTIIDQALNSSISDAEALDQLTELLEIYYGVKYPLPNEMRGPNWPNQNLHPSKTNNIPIEEDTKGSRVVTRRAVTRRFWQFDRAMKVGLLVGFTLYALLSISTGIRFEVAQFSVLGGILFASVLISRLIEILLGWIRGAISSVRK